MKTGDNNQVDKVKHSNKVILDCFSGADGGISFAIMLTLFNRGE